MPNSFTAGPGEMPYDHSDDEAFERAAELLLEERDQKALELIEAVRQGLPLVPDFLAPCHLGICTQDQCGYCQRVIAAHAALREIEELL